MKIKILLVEDDMKEIFISDNDRKNISEFFENLNVTSENLKKITSNADKISSTIDDFSEYRALSQTTVSYPITKWLAWNTKVNFQYNNNPPEGLSKLDTELLNNITITF